MTQESINPELISTAYHEAGHAVASVVLKLPFQYVSIVPAKDYIGVLWRSEDTYADRDLYHLNFRRELRHLMVCALCGWQAELRFNPEQSHEVSRDDVSMANDWAWNIYLTRAQRHFKDWERQAKRLIASHWPSIERVADALLARQTLDESEVFALCEAVTP